MTKRELPDLLRQMRRVFHAACVVELCDGSARLLRDEALTEEEERLFAHCGKGYVWKPLPPGRSVERMIRLGDEMILVIDRYLSLDGDTCVLELALRNISNVIIDDSEVPPSIEQLHKKIYQDSLTQVYNRRYYDEHFAPVEDIDAAVAIMDVDRFKVINDTYGHLVGDQVLRLIAQTIQRHVRPTDAVIRYGGDEFLLIFQRIPFDVFRRKLEQIGGAVAEARVEDRPEIRTTLSIGGCCRRGDVSGLLEEADRCLYQAKKKKNTIVLRGPESNPGREMEHYEKKEQEV